MMDRLCKWCNSKFDISDKPNGWMANHTRWCNENPKRQEYINALKERDSVKLMHEAKKKSGYVNQYAKAKLNGHKIDNPLKGKKHPNPFKKHTKESIEKIRTAALASDHRRLRKGMVEYKGIMLDSSWELELAKRLDELNVKWIRPKSIPWTDAEGRVRRYFPDFYLPEHDLYLDPKNKHAYNVQKEKIDILLATYDNIQFITDLDDIKNFTTYLDK